MRRVLCAIAALAIAMPAAYAARDNNRHDGGPGNGRGQQSAPVQVPPSVSVTRAAPGRGNFQPNTRTFSFRGVYHPAIRGPIFSYPRGYNYVRFNIGARLPTIFISSPYFFNDYYGLGIYPPPPGYRWVRYGPDLLLVDLYTGQVDDVIYDVFY